MPSSDPHKFHYGILGQDLLTRSICVIPRTHNNFGDESFSAAAPHVRNALPSYLRQDMNYKHQEIAGRTSLQAADDHGAL